MSQIQEIDVVGSQPAIPTSFVTDSGTAIPALNILNVFGGLGIMTSGAGNTVLISSIGGQAFTNITVDAHTAPGTNPVIPTIAGGLTITGAQVAAGTTANVLRTDSLAANAFSIQIQRSQAVASSTIGDNGVAHFNSANFTVDGNGFVSLVGGGAPIEAINLQSGTSPINPSAGAITFNGAVVAAGTNPVRTDGTGASTMALEVQISQAIAATDATKIGLSNFNSNQFTVDGNGFVSLVGNAPAIEKVNVQTGTSPIVPTSGAITINGATVAAGTNPVRTDGTGANTLAVEVQISQAIASTDATKIGLAAFNSAQFTVDGNGFVSEINGLTTAKIGVDANTAPGTNPVLPTAAGQINITGGQVAAGTTTNVIQTNSLAANAFTIQIQRSQAVASSTIGDNGVCHFDSGVFTVDGNGFVSLVGAAAAIEKINLQTGTTPTVPSSGAITFNGAVVAAGTNPVRTDGTGVNTMALEVQISQAIASTDATKIGLANFDSASFAVDANGFVTAAGGGLIKTITGNSNGAEVPLNGNFNILGTGSITVVGSANTETVQLTGLTNHNVLVGAGSATITNVAPSATAGIPLVSNGASSDPSFTTAVVAGGGTGDTSFTAYAPICGGTTTTGNLQSASTGLSTAGFVLVSNGASALPSFQAIGAANAFSSIVIQTFTANGTYTPTANMKYCWVRMVGSGGAGGGSPAASATQYAVAGGGAAGEYGEGIFTAATIGASQAVTIGAAATGNSGTAGNNGNTTSLGALLTAAGGGGGTSGPASTVGSQANGGQGGSGGTGGSFHTEGSFGGIGFASVASILVPGSGANSFFGAGGAFSTNNSNGAGAQANSGAGGGGTTTSNHGAVSGGISGAGFVVIMEFI